MSVDAFLASAAVTGCLGAGGLLMVHAAWRLRRPTFAQRVAAGRVAAPSSRAARDSGWMLRALESIGSTTSSVERRLILLGAETDMAAFRLHQVATGIGLTAIALLIGAPLAVGRGVQGVFVLLLISIIGFIGGLGAWDRLLTHRSGTRQRRIDMEVPDMSELLALAVGAGESIPAALERVAQISSTDLNGEVAKTVSEIRLGASSTKALADLADRNDSPSLDRLCQTLITAIERGAPLARVLHDQARDIREASRQRLMEEGGKREIAMLVPVVFLILPVTVLFALYPGLMALDIAP
ncbi:type II secretion system F family protein [Actinomyces mediterranea]|uniref:type II secretion system F family protein n=1 Tax=Actinomyces mediterranea TaxID=1871028 RepID=UPI000970932D|nr:type II secretion system F family protein [Actinomyces mediterranea]